ncbi:MAG: hypothetical protein JSV31_23880 [Desulfobacterales bacterium]|nr:MAG: hypothetical protein JSV31_23880 [Desulfobacterales bacterium]
MKSFNVIIRRFEEKDREAIREICKRTGQKGHPARLFFEDEEIVPMLFADYYMDYEPRSCFVAEVDGRVVGYLVGCLDTRRKIKVMRTRIYPRLCLRMLWKILTFQYRMKQTYQTLWWMISRSWRESLRLPLDEYPGHAHFNVEAAYRSEGLGRRLGRTFRQHRLKRGVWGTHIIIREEEGQDNLSAYFCRERGYKIVSIKRNTVWEKVTGKKWYAKLLVCDARQFSEGDPDASPN